MLERRRFLTGLAGLIAAKVSGLPVPNNYASIDTAVAPSEVVVWCDGFVRVRHPLLAEAVIRHQATPRGELIPCLT